MRAPSTISLAGAIAMTAAGLALACGGGAGSPSGPSGPVPVVAGSIGATISLTAAGASPIDVRIELTQKVRFVNNDTRPHEINTNPHNLHTDCPPNNSAIINPGQAFDTAIFTEIKACGYHNHLLPDNQSFWGLIRVGTNDDNKGPVYSKGW
ncbi:MAG: hypothetical protein WD690_16920 [Vicinamibacterales bacterium]